METQKKKVTRGEKGISDLPTELAVSRLNAALEAKDLSSFMSELGQVIKARGGYTSAARASGLNRTALYKIASYGGNPALDTLLALLAPLGLRLSVKIAKETGSGQETETQLKPTAYPVLTDHASLRE